MGLFTRKNPSCAWRGLLAVLLICVGGRAVAAPPASASDPAPAAATQAAEPAHDQAQSAEDKSAAAPPWAIYRGSPDMRGVAHVALPQKPALLWKFKTGDAVRSSAVVANGIAYIGSNDGHVYALRLNSDDPAGDKRWSFRVGSGGGEEEPWPIEAPPLYLDGLIIIGAGDGVLYALDAATGAVKWKYRTDAKILGSANWTAAPAGAPDEGGKRIIVGSYDNMLHCVNARTGEAIWTYETDNYINGAPAIEDGRIIFGGCDGYVHAVAANNGKKLTHVAIDSPIVGTVALAEGKAFAGHFGNAFVCVDLEASKLVWEFKDRNFAFMGAPAVYEKYVVFGGQDRRLHAIDRETGQEYWQFKTRGKVDSSPVICINPKDKNDARIVVGCNDGRVYIVRLADGESVFDYEIGSEIISSPAVVDGVIVIGADDGFVYAFGEKR